MKKFLTFILAAILTISLAACGSSSKPITSTNKTSSSANTNKTNETSSSANKTSKKENELAGTWNFRVVGEDLVGYEITFYEDETFEIKNSYEILTSGNYETIVLSKQTIEEWDLSEYVNSPEWGNKLKIGTKMVFLDSTGGLWFYTLDKTNSTIKLELFDP